MAAEQPFCKFHQYVHCKFGSKCKKFHTTETCLNFPCKLEACRSRHPSQCKFFSLFGKCKFYETCSYLHIVAGNTVDKILSDKIKVLKEENDSNKEKIRVFEHEIENFRRRIFEMEAVLLRFDKMEIEIQTLKEHFSDTKQLENFYCDICEYKASR